MVRLNTLESAACRFDSTLSLCWSWRLSRSRRVSEDSAIGVIFASFFALGVVILSREGGFRQAISIIRADNAYLDPGIAAQFGTLSNGFNAGTGTPGTAAAPRALMLTGWPKACPPPPPMGQ